MRTMIPSAAGRLAGAVIVITSLACAPAAAPSATGAAAPTPTQSAALGWMLGDEVLVLPIQRIELGEGVSGDTAALRIAFDTGFQAAVEPAAGGRWAWPPALIALRRRNPTAMPDPTRLSVGGLRLRTGADAQLPQDLGSEIRAILAISGARRYVLLPLRLAFSLDASGDHGYEVVLVAVDSRRALVRQSVAVRQARAGTLEQAFANAVGVAARSIVPAGQ